MLILPISARQFDVYGLALARGPNFDPYHLHSAWQSADKLSVGAVLIDTEAHLFGVTVMRRRVDHRFVITQELRGIRAEEAALNVLTTTLRSGDPPEPLPSGVKRRPLLLDTGSYTVGEYFKLLTTKLSHFPALMTVGEAYLAMPRPDSNFVSDFQTVNFSSRLWELYLVAAFREQGITVSQDYVSPDFLIEREGHACFVEAVTAHPKDGPIRDFHKPTFAPADRDERTLGAPATRFAKTLRSKLQRDYHSLPHVQGKPFAFAVADFHAPGAMTWSREALPSYLYGLHFKREEGQPATATEIESLRDGQPAGLFRDPEFAHVSAVMFSNAGTLSKFNRMGFLAGWRPPGLKMIRIGHFFDRTPGAVASIPFEHDILSDDYATLWPWGEAWCQELEVFHNPLAGNPIAHALLPGATHWFERNGEIECSSMWKWSVLSSITHIGIERSEPSHE